MVVARDLDRRNTIGVIRHCRLDGGLVIGRLESKPCQVSDCVIVGDACAVTTWGGEVELRDCSIIAASLNGADAYGSFPAAIFKQGESGELPAVRNCTVIGYSGLVLENDPFAVHPVLEDQTQLLTESTFIRRSDIEDLSPYLAWEMGPEEPEPAFADVDQADECWQAVAWALSNRITNGTGEGAFSPDRPCTRAEAVVFLWRAAGSLQVEGNSFPDVPKGCYYEDAVKWAVKAAIVNGAGGKFLPDAPCSRAQMASILYRYRRRPAVQEEGFSDVPRGSYYEKAAIWAAANQIIPAGAGGFSPEGVCTRGQVVTMLWRTMKQNREDGR